MAERLNKLSNGTIALLIAGITVILLTITAPQIGLTWDEPIYIAASESYMGWFTNLMNSTIDTMKSDVINSYWAINHEHPPLDKIWSGVVWAVARFFGDDLTAHRLGNILLVGTLSAMLYLMVSQTYRRTAGLVAVAALLSMPRFFFHAHLAALDVPVAVSIFAVIFLFWLTRDRQGNGWDVCLGVAWGLAFMFKINAIFILPMLFVWMVLFYRRWYLFWRLVTTGFVGLPTSILVWPWLYHDTSSRFKHYLGFMSVDHWKLGTGVWYFGQFYNPPPWHFPFVMTLAVVPLTLTILYFVGIVRTVKEVQQQLVQRPS